MNGLKEQLAKLPRTALLIGLTVMVGCVKRPAPGAGTQQPIRQREQPRPGGMSEQPPPASTTSAARDAATLAATAEIDRLLGSRYLRLATDQESGAANYHFTVWVARRTERNQIRSTNIDVVCDGGQVALLCSSASGLPYCYMREGLFVAIDGKRPGGLMMYRRGGPTFLLGADDTDHLNFVLSYAGRTTKPYVLLDLRSLLRSTKHKLRKAAFDANTGRIEGETEFASVWIEVRRSSAPDEVPVKELITTNGRAGQAVGVVDVGIHSPAPRNLIVITQEAVEALSLPVRPLNEEDVNPMDLLTPAGFPATAGEREAAMRLQELFARPASAVPRGVPPKGNPPTAQPLPPAPVKT